MNTENNLSEEAVQQLGRLFWDHPLAPEDLKTYPAWVVERVLEYGSLSDVALLRDQMGRQAFISTVASAQRLSRKTANFWHLILETEKPPCTKKHCRNTAWNC